MALDSTHHVIALVRIGALLHPQRVAHAQKAQTVRRCLGERVARAELQADPVLGRRGRLVEAVGGAFDFDLPDEVRDRIHDHLVLLMLPR
jgi:hypothetical protein